MALNLRETIQSLIQSLIEQNNETNYCNMAYRDGTLGSHDWKIIFLGISGMLGSVFSLTGISLALISIYCLFM